MSARRALSFSFCGGCLNSWVGPDAAHAPCCHDTFEDVHLFDAHRDRGRCLDPAMVDAPDGSPVMEWRDEMWRRP